MRLNSLEIFGFKSFPHRTRLEFNAGVAAVVGPNGCGKSNVADAFRWCLGEQSAKSLRGDVMEDLIFNGTADTPPLSLAEVSLTFSDCLGSVPLDADELVVTRRMYRSGESHFFINNRPVRLKDVRELFADTGLGKASYAVIEQGMVEAIVRAKADERREIFEEAAGIRGYRAKRAEAMRKLDEVQANMERLEDLYAEYQRQARALKRQAGAARRYQGLRDRFRDLEVGLGKIKYRGLAEGKRVALSRRDELSAAHREAKTRVAAASAEVARLGAEIAAAEIALEQREKDLLARQAELKEVEASRRVAEEKQRSLREDLDRLAVEYERLNVEIQNAVAEEERLGAAWAEGSRRVAELEARTGELEKRLAAAAEIEAGLAGVLEAARADQLRRLDERTNLANLFATAAAARESLARELSRLRREVEAAAERLRLARASQQKLFEERGDVEAALASCRREAADIAAAEKASAAALAEAETRVAETAQRRHFVQSRLATLEDLARRFESFESGVAALMKAGAPEGVAGLLADALKVRDGYEAAVERALGYAAGALLAADLATATGLAGRLAADRTGRAAFIVPGSAPGDEADLPVIEGVRGWAADFVAYEGPYAGAVGALLRGVLVVDGLEALADAAALYPRVPIATLNGDWWDGRALLLAGSPDEPSATILGRRAEITKLTAEEQALARREEEERSEVARLKAAREELSVRREELAAREAQLGLAQADVQAALRGAERDGLTWEENRALLSNEAADAEGRLAAAFGEEETLGTQLAATTCACEESGGAVAAADENLRAARARADDNRRALAEAREEAAALRENLKGMGGARERLAEVRARDGAELERVAAVRNQRAAEEGELAAHIDALAGTVAGAGDAFTAAEGAVKDLRFGVNDAGARRRAAEEARASAENVAEEVAEALKEKELEIAAVVGEMNALDEAFAAKHAIRLSTLSAEEYALGVEAPAAELEKDELGRRLAKMGDVNFLAAREYDELAAHIATLDEQRADLAQARANLDESIARLDAESREVFVATFGRIREEFQQTFRGAFGGGQADLKLQNGVDPLEAGVYIYAQPPGKKMEHLSLLSGGEKALTAIALIFALFNVRPAPFAILDEVDAPLDENSINRFLALLGHYRRRVQFMIISHARRTMEAADVIYGVTMERKGISKVLSLKFDEVPEEYMEVAAAREER